MLKDRKTLYNADQLIKANQWIYCPVQHNLSTAQRVRTARVFRALH
jgi:hypothetical protein